ncbi:MAG: helix-turn-helix domain-containing protein [Elusimicrobia bacterium]|nr:helix-turn-helix domain-containing protein [Elusimicrobiota bacterium]
MTTSTKIKLPSPTERMELILLGMARQESVQILCRQAGVSRELFYRWMKKVRKAGLAALEAQPPGPKSAWGSPNPGSCLPKTQDRIRRLERLLA